MQLVGYFSQPHPEYLILQIQWHHHNQTILRQPIYTTMAQDTPLGMIHLQDGVHNGIS